MSCSSNPRPMDWLTCSSAGRPSAITGTVNTGSGTASSPVGAKLSMGTCLKERQRQGGVAVTRGYNGHIEGLNWANDGVSYMKKEARGRRILNVSTENARNSPCQKLRNDIDEHWCSSAFCSYLVNALRHAVVHQRRKGRGHRSLIAPLRGCWRVTRQRDAVAAAALDANHVLEAARVRDGNRVAGPGRGKRHARPHFHHHHHRGGGRRRRRRGKTAHQESATGAAAVVVG